MITRVLGVVLITFVFGALAEVIVRRNRRERAHRSRLADTGQPITGTVHHTDRVSAGKYGSYKVRAEIRYTAGGGEHTHIAAWWPTEAPDLQQGAPVPLLVDPTDPAVACVHGGAAPDLERDSLWRWLTAGVFVVAVVAAVLS